MLSHSRQTFDFALKCVEQVIIDQGISSTFHHHALKGVAIAFEAAATKLMNEKVTSNLYTLNDYLSQALRPEEDGVLITGDVAYHAIAHAEKAFFGEGSSIFDVNLFVEAYGECENPHVLLVVLQYIFEEIIIAAAMEAGEETVLTKHLEAVQKRSDFAHIFKLLNITF